MKRAKRLPFRPRLTGLAALICVSSAAPAFADLTAFLGTNTTPANRLATGLSVGTGVGLLIVGFEFEYAQSPDDPNSGAPSLKTGSTNILLQTPVAIHGVQPYATTGVGFYKEVLGTHDELGPAFNTGAGVKLSLAGPLRLRVDYRVFKLGSGARYSPAHRVYVGLNLRF
jgi:Outer membrane protein beta-barrel domain